MEGVARAHDANGNLTSFAGFDYSYDYRNRLVEVLPIVDQDVLASYEYDTFNRRRAKTVFDLGSPGTIVEERHYLYDEWNVIGEWGDDDDYNNNGPVATYVYGPGIDQPIQTETSISAPGGAGLFYYHRDARNNIVAMTDALGAVVEKTRYDDFGNFTRDPSIGQPYLYQGRWYDSETGLFYYRNRYYDPVVGRFIQRDPVWDPNNVGNQYTFVGNNPASRFDPLGLQDDEDDGEEGDEQTPDPTGGTGGSDGAREDGVIVTWLKSYFFGDKSICKNMTISRSSKSSHGVPDPLGHTMLESTPEERAEQQELENRTNAAGDAAAGGAAIVASGLHPAEAATGLVVGEAVDNVSEPTEEPGILRTIWNALTSIFD